jgi:hypothetical protein
MAGSGRCRRRAEQLVDPLTVAGRAGRVRPRSSSSRRASSARLTFWRDGVRSQIARPRELVQLGRRGPELTPSRSVERECGQRHRGELARELRRRTGELQGQLVHARVVADHQHRPDIVGQTRRASSSRALAPYSSRSTRTGARPSAGSTRSSVSRARRAVEHSTSSGSNSCARLCLASVFAALLPRPPEAGVVRKLGVLPTRLGVPQQVDALHRPPDDDRPQRSSRWTTSRVIGSRIANQRRRDSTPARRARSSSDPGVWAHLPRTPPFGRKGKARDGLDPV